VNKTIRNESDVVVSTVSRQEKMIGTHVLCVMLVLSLFLSMSIAEEPKTQNEMNITPVLKTREIRNEKGDLEKIESYYIDPSGKEVLHGHQIEMADGHKFREYDYVDGKKNGPFIEWRGASPYICRKGYYRRDQRIGSWLMWNCPEELRSMEFYDKDVPTGTWIDWHSNGQKASECTYKDGCIKDKKLYWRENGDIYQENIYNGKGIQLEVTTWHPNGKKMMRGTYLDQKDIKTVLENQKGLDLQDGRWTYWDEEGNIVADGVWKDGKPWEGVCGKVSGGSLSSIYYVQSLLLARYKDGKMIEEVTLPSSKESDPKEKRKDKKSDLTPGRS
jgi:antitoxin component YwqK of YwqJK toxin-antitoxin module